MSLPSVSSEQILLIIAILVGLLLLSFVHNKHIDRENDLAKESFGAAIHVVVGVGYTLVGSISILSILFGLEPALWVMYIVLGCFVVSGVPMIFGELNRNALRHHRLNELAAQREREALVKEMVDGNRG